MIIVDNALRSLEEQGRSIRVGMIGARYAAAGLQNLSVERFGLLKAVLLLEQVCQAL